MKKMFAFFSLVFLWVYSCNYAIAYTGKWFNPRMIKTYIQPDHKYSLMMKHGFAEWDRLTNGKVRFKYVNSANVAQIEVRFVKQINQKQHDRAIGLTNTMTVGSDKKMTKAIIYIAEKDRRGRNLRKDEAYTVILHEIGHAIGLEHSSDPKSAMYYAENDIQEISKNDLRQLKKLYGWN